MASLGRHDSWAGVRAVVAGLGVSGFAAADNLTHLGASVTVLDESAAGDREDRRDLPGGATRIVRRAVGYHATLVNGEVVFRDGEPTGRLPGRVLRGSN